MAMQYQQLSSEIQAQGLRTIYLMNPNSLGYSDSNQTPQSNFLNPSAAGHAFTSCLTAHAPPEEITAAVHDLWADRYSSNMPILQQKGPSLNLPRSCDHQISQLYPGESSKYAMADGDMEINVITGSKYVKAAQELLEEMVSVLGVEGGGKKTVIAKTEDVAWVGDGDELTMAQRQEVLMKKARLSGMLEEVNVRRKQYHQRIQLMVSSLEDVAGIGSARAYTEAALHTILRQFGRLRTTILGQIKGLNKRLGEDKEEVKMGSRLRMVDRQIKQQRALEQAGLMMMPNAPWRPQRGLPERAVAILRAWLFDHFLHPYPKDADKQMLANKAGLTRSQVSNWFINARVRLWKPMVEAMYVEETNSKTNQHHTPIPISSCPDTILVPSSKTMSSSLQHQGNPHPSFITHDTHLPPPKKLHCHDTRLSPLAAAATATKPHQLPTTTTTNNPGGGALLLDTAVYGNSSICQLNRDYHHGLQGVTSLNTTGFQGNGFSLTLGLSCPETSSAGDRQQNRFMAGTSFGGIDTTTNNNNNLQGTSQRVNGYEIIDFQNRRKATTITTFQPQSQLLPDFFGLTG